MDIDVSCHTAEWVCDGRKVVIEEHSLHQAIYSHQLNLVVALCGADKEPKYISLYDPNGIRLKEISEPADCYFNYLGENRGHEVAVMVKTYISGWVDWWYRIDVENGELVSLGEGR